MIKDDKIFAIKKEDIKNNVEMQKIVEGEYISNNGNWTVTRDKIYFNYEDASYPVGDMENVPKAVEEIFHQLQNEK